MKKFYFLFSALILTSLGFLQAQNVPTNWNIITSDITVTEETTTVNEGVKAMSVTWTSTDNQDIKSDAFTVTPGAAFTYTLDVYDNDAGGRVRMAIAWSSANGFSEVYSTDLAEWQNLTYEGTVPAEATTGQILLRFYDVTSGWTGSATIIVDNASYSENGGENLLANPGFETWGEPVLNPSLTVTAPTNGSTVNVDNVDVVFSVENFELGVDGQVEFVLNGGTAAYSSTSPYNVTGLLEGSNTLNIQLVDMSNAPLDPVVLVTRTFNYEIPSTDPLITIDFPTEGSTVYSSDVNISFSLENFIPGTDGKIAYSVDGGADVFQITADDIELAGLSYAEHTVDFELVDMSELPLDPAVTTSVTFTCAEALPGGMETFELSNIGATYTDGSFIGDDDITWNYFHSRDTDIYPINNKGLMLRRGSDSKLVSQTLTGGIASFQLSMRKAFTGTSTRQLELYINEILVATSQEFGAFSGEDATVYTFYVSDIDIPGDFTIMVKPAGTATTNSQVTIDDIIWTGFESTDPYLSITSPANAEEVTIADVDIVFNVMNFELGTEGRVKYTVDGGTDQFTTTSPIALTDLADGEHTVAMELVDMSDLSLDPAVTDEVTFNVNTAPPTYTTIYEIQYTTIGDGSSPLATTTVTTKGVVSGVFEDKFWIQDGAGAWNGVYVYYTTTPGPARGDSVTVAGTVAEYNYLTEISPVTNVTVLNSGNIVADATALSTGNVGVEMYEGVLVTTTGVCTNADAGYGMWEINDGSGVILIDDTMYPYTAVLGNSYTVTGLVDYSFDEWKILPRDAADVVDNGASTDPMLTVSSPTNGATIYSDATDVVFSVSNFELGTEGKVAWNIDGGTDAYVTASPILVTGLTEGPHTINLELVDMSNVSLDPAVTVVINITVNLAGPEYTDIYDIQYTTDAEGDSPLIGEEVWVRAVVTANFNESEHFEGYFIQQGAGAWNGIYVYDLVNSPEIGDSVAIAASVDEFHYMTQLENVTSFEVIIPGGIVPTATVVSTADANTEQYEACLIKVHDAECTVAQNTFGEWTVNDGTADLVCQDNDMFTFAEIVSTHYDITGVTFFSYGAFELNYRIESDIVVLANIDTEFASQISIYPNPASDFINIDLTEGADIITITDVVGQIISETIVNSDLLTIDLNNMKAGVYFATISKADKTAVIKFIVE